MLAGVLTRLEDLSSVLSQTADHRLNVLQGIAQNLEEWILVVSSTKPVSDECAFLTEAGSRHVKGLSCNEETPWTMNQHVALCPLVVS